MTIKETFHEVTAELLTDECGKSVLLTQQSGVDEPSEVLLHPLQLRHFAERFAGMEPIGWMSSEPVKTLARRLRTLAFHTDFLYDYIKNHSDHKHADLTFELTKVTALSEMADEFCADLPEDPSETEDVPNPQPAPAKSASKGAATAVQAALI